MRFKDVKCCFCLPLPILATGRVSREVYIEMVFRSLSRSANSGAVTAWQSVSRELLMPHL